MKYKIVKMTFPKGVHFGKRNLDESEICFHSDTLFSALCLEMLQTKGEKELEQFVNEAKEGKILLSDAFPFMGEHLYIPKPGIHIQTQSKEGSSIVKKAMKKLKYIEIEDLTAFIKGNYPIEKADELSTLGGHQIKTSAAIRGLEETNPFRVMSYHFNPGNGLYVIIAADENVKLSALESLFVQLSYSGLGGKRSSGYGRFQVEFVEPSEEFTNRLDGDYTNKMLLSVALPKEEELEEVLKDASYQIIKRSGFVASTDYADEFMRKKDLYVFDSGACFMKEFEGDVYDVSVGGRHAVYRYAKPMFMGVE